MNYAEGFVRPEPLRGILARLKGISGDWLYVPAGTTILSADTPCSVCTIDERDLSPQEVDELEAFPATIGLQAFLGVHDLRGIVDNLGQQQPAYSESQLIAAINFYWEKDAYMVIEPGGAGRSAAAVLTRVEAFRLLVAVVASNDLASLRTLIDGGAFSRQDAPSVEKAGADMQAILRAWDYTATPEFLDSVAGKSPAVESMKRKLAADPVHRAERRDAFIAALRSLMETDDVFALAPAAEHGRLRRIRHDVELWANPKA